MLKQGLLGEFNEDNVSQMQDLPFRLEQPYCRSGRSAGGARCVWALVARRLHGSCADHPDSALTAVPFDGPPALS